MRTAKYGSFSVTSYAEGWVAIDKLDDDGDMTIVEAGPCGGYSVLVLFTLPNRHNM